MNDGHVGIICRPQHFVFEAWMFLGLKGSEDEIQDSFASVDTNNSGLVDIDEFKTAIKSDRLMELNMTSLFEKLGIQVATKEERFRAFEATARRRRLMKQQYEEQVAICTKEIIEKLAAVSGREVPSKDPEKQEIYNVKFF